MRASDFTSRNNLTVYVDMDGVLADLFNHVAEIHDVEHYNHMSNQQWEEFFKNTDAYQLFRDIPAFSTANKLLQMVKDFAGGYTILSSPLNYDVSNSIRGKKEWIKKHITVPADDIIFEHDKYKYATTNGNPNVLIDDFGDNIRKWRQAGGIAIKYQADEDSLLSVFQSLQRLVDHPNTPVAEARKKRKKRKKFQRAAAWGPGPYGGYGAAAGYSGTDGVGEGWKSNLAGAALGTSLLFSPNDAAANYPSQIVKPGDTVYSIAKAHNAEVNDIVKANDIQNFKISPGQELIIPIKKSKTVSPSVVKKAPATSLDQKRKIDTSKTVTGSSHELTLKRAAIAAGIKGTELAAFLAQCAHETMNFNSLVELGNKHTFKQYDPKYSPKKAKALGNTQVGDGERYKGRGFIQLTGRYNYKKAGEALGLPLEERPELVEHPAIASKVAVWFWQHRVQPNVDNFNNVKAVTKPINPGLKGLENRSAMFKDFKSSLR